jgi:hypothetical protein
MHLLEEKEVAFLSDLQIGKLLGFSGEWVRQQRYFRRHGKKHSLQIDPIYIGTKPRYRATEIFAWIERLNAGPVGTDQSPPQNIELTQ